MSERKQAVNDIVWLETKEKTIVLTFYHQSKQ